MYPVCTGSAALQRRVRRGQTSAKAAEVEDLSGFSDFLPSPITRASRPTLPKSGFARAQTAGGNCQTALAKFSRILIFPEGLSDASLLRVSGLLIRVLHSVDHF
jgi:hypothetical protein